jgi:hypothetical protein
MLGCELTRSANRVLTHRSKKYRYSISEQVVLAIHAKTSSSFHSPDERDADKTIATRYAMTVGLASALALIANHN